MTIEEAIAHGREQLEVFGGEHAEFIKLSLEALEHEAKVTDGIKMTCPVCGQHICVELND